MKILSLLLVCLLLPAATWAAPQSRPAGLPDGQDPGTLTVLTRDGEKPAEPLRLPLEHTDVQIEINGFVARVTLTQRYGNPFDEAIEAVYAFPLPNKAAVDGMTMHIGDRTIRAEIKRREEARRVYEQAKAAGKRTGLLEQERPNIFTQSIANILPGDRIEIEISYVEILQYRDTGEFELVFPMVVGPRYIPGDPNGRSGAGWSPDTDQVPDASRVTPPVLRPGERSGHDISVSVGLDAGLPVRALHSPSHAVDIGTLSDNRRQVSLHPIDRIPNKDFILRYRTAGDAPQFALITHQTADQGGYFTLLALPQVEVNDDLTVPRDLIFIVDTSGSMRGRPMAQSKQVMYRLIDGMRGTDRFNIVRFAGDSARLWSEPRSKTGANVREARAFVDGMRGAGGTEMRHAIIDALARPADPGRLRIALLLTDGYVGNEDGILGAIERERHGARVFALGVGSAPNRFLLDRTALVGRGDVFSVRPDEDASPVVERFFRRVDRPTLTDIAIDWGNVDVTDLTPVRIPDLWAGQPLLIHGRYARGGQGAVKITGQLGSERYSLAMPASFPTGAPENSLMATVWARAKVKELMAEGIARTPSPEAIERITRLGLDYRILTRWTAFVAVEEKIVNEGGQQRTVMQPVELPELVDPEGVGSLQELARPQRAAPRYAPALGARPLGSAGLFPHPSRMQEPTIEAVEDEDGTMSRDSAGMAQPVPLSPMSACRHRDLTVSGGLRYPDVDTRLERALLPICKWLIEVHPQPLHIAVRLTLDGKGRVSTMQLMPRGSMQGGREGVRNELLQRLKQLEFGAVPGGGKVVIGFDLVVGPTAAAEAR